MPHPSCDQLQRTTTCVGYSEIDKYAIQIYERHFPQHRNFGDATKINASELPDFDLLVGGFPCQAFSIAGKRLGLEDSRGTLFYDIARIAQEKRPQHLLLENVKGLLSHDGGGTFKTIIATFAELGYNLEWQIINSKNFGVPQNRERVFIIGHLGRCCGRQVFPLTKDDQLPDSPDETGGTRAQAELSTTVRIGMGNKADSTFVVSGTLRTHKDGNGFREVKSGHAPTIPARAREDGSGQPVILTGSPKYVDGQREVSYKETDTVPTIRATHYKSGDNQPVVLENTRIRRLTPTECERLQGFPDGWTEGVIDTQRYKTLGNGVTVNVITEIIKRLIY